MSPLASLLKDDIHWNRIAGAVESGSSPAALGVSIRESMQKDFMLMYAHYLLCETGTDCGVCDSCRAWVDGTHPDLIIAGEPGEPAGVDDCRSLSGDLTLVPVVSQSRLLVIFAPEKMSVGAENSLLKITEEPPIHGRILYMMDKPDILPTLRSRLWMVSFYPEEKIQPVTPPSSEPEWLKWLTANAKNDTAAWSALADGYITYYKNTGRYDKAAMLCQIAGVAEETHLSSTMWADMLFLFLREEYPFEQIFDDLRQTALPRSADRKR